MAPAFSSDVEVLELPPDEKFAASSDGSEEHPWQAYTNPAEAKKDLEEFLKVVCPEWSMFPSRHGPCNTARVMEKLTAIGVVDVWDLVDRVERKTLNEQLSSANQPCFNQATLARMRDKRPFLRAMEHLRAPHYRQEGIFAPVPQLFAKTNLRRDWQDGRDAKIRDADLDAETSPGRSRPCNAPEEFDARPSLMPVEVLPVARPSSAACVRGQQRRATVASVNAAGIVSELEPPLIRRMISEPSFASNAASNANCGNGAGERRATVPDLASNVNSLDDRQDNSPPDGERRRMPPHLRRPEVPMAIAAAQAYAMQHGCSQEDILRPARIPLRFAAGPSRRARSRSSSTTRSSGSRPGNAVGAVLSSGDPRQYLAAARRAARRRESDPGQGQRRGVGRCGKPSGVPHAMTETQSVPEAAWDIDVLERGEAMLKEAECLDEKTQLYRQFSQQGIVSPTRKVVANNVKARLSQEAEYDSKVAVKMQQQCQKIRHGLTSMANSRREVSLLRAQMKSEMGLDTKNTLRTSVLDSLRQGFLTKNSGEGEQRTDE